MDKRIHSTRCVSGSLKFLSTSFSQWEWSGFAPTPFHPRSGLQPSCRFARRELYHLSQQRLNTPCSSKPILRCLERLCLRNGSQASFSEGATPKLNVWFHRMVFINGGIQKWLVQNGTSQWNWWFGGTPILGNHHIPSTVGQMRTLEAVWGEDEVLACNRKAQMLNKSKQ